jgi:DNA topoisomerase-3
MMPLADAARCRSEADWLVGINGTRAMTAFNSRDGGFYLTTVGRVQTPTLAIVVDREDQDPRFVPRDYFESPGQLQRQGRRVRRALVRSAVQEGRRRRTPRRAALGTRPSADAIVAACKGKPASSTKKPSRPPRSRRSCST